MSATQDKVSSHRTLQYIVTAKKLVFIPRI